MVSSGPTNPPPPTTVAVTFNEVADTFFGQNIFVVGSIPELASWDTSSAVPLTFPQPLPNSPSGSGGKISTFFSPNFASPRSTFS